MRMTEQQFKSQIKEQMRKAALARSPESRKQGGRKAWQTRKANALNGKV